MGYQAANDPAMRWEGGTVQVEVEVGWGTAELGLNAELLIVVPRSGTSPAQIGFHCCLFWVTI